MNVPHNKHLHMAFALIVGLAHAAAFLCIAALIGALIAQALT